MTGYDIQKWQRCEALAKLCGVVIEVKQDFLLCGSQGLCLGSFPSLNEVFAFLCGYEHYQRQRYGDTGQGGLI